MLVQPEEQTENEKNPFWKNAIKYTSQNAEHPFVREMAFIMVTLHKTGAS